MSSRLSLMEAGYRLDLSEQEFLHHLGDAARPFFQGHEHFLLYSVQLRNELHPLLRASHVVSGDLYIIQTMLRLILIAMGDDTYARYTMSFPSTFINARSFGARIASAQHDSWLNTAEDLGVPDFVGFMCNTQDDNLLMIGSPHQSIVEVSESEERLNRPLASHLAAAWRLRLRLSEPSLVEESAEAIFSPGGECVSAQNDVRHPSVREALRRVVLQRERRSQRHLTKQAEHLWPELIAGRWTLIDRFDLDGRRYVVAYRNDPKASPLTRLSSKEQQLLAMAREGLSNKQLALSLYTSESSVSRSMHRALRKLGVESALEMARLSSDEGSRFDIGLGPDQLRVIGLSSKEVGLVESLSPAEREISADIIRGLSNQEIAARRKRSQRTIVNQIASIFSKLNVGSRRGLMLRLGRWCAP